MLKNENSEFDIVDDKMLEEEDDFSSPIEEPRGAPSLEKKPILAQPSLQ